MPPNNYTKPMRNKSMYRHAQRDIAIHDNGDMLPAASPRCSSTGGMN